MAHMIDFRLRLRKVAEKTSGAQQMPRPISTPQKGIPYSMMRPTCVTSHRKKTLSVNHYSHDLNATLTRNLGCC